MCMYAYTYTYTYMYTYQYTVRVLWLHILCLHISIMIRRYSLSVYANRVPTMNICICISIRPLT